MSKSNKTAEKRVHERINAPALVTIEDHTYRVENWSINGFKAVGFDQAVKTGDCFPIQLQLNWKKAEREITSISITTLIEVVWVSAYQGQFGAQFLNLTKLEKDLLQDAINQINKGELTLLEHAEQPTLPGSGPSKTSQLPSKRVLYTFMYLILGGVLGFFCLRAVYDSLANLEIKSANVAKPSGPIVAPVESMVTKEQGIVDELYVHEGMNIKPGQPLFSVKNDELAERDIDSLNRDIQLNRIALAQAQADLREAELLKQQEIEKLGSYQTISQTKLDSAQTEVKSRTAQYQVEKNNLDRFATLLKQGAVSQKDYDAVRSRFAEAEVKLQEAQSNYRVAQVAVSSAQQGNFYDGDQLVSDLPRRTAEVEKQRQLVQIASQKLVESERMLNQRVQELQIANPQRQYLQQPVQTKTLLSRPAFSVVYKAPFPGSVLKVTKTSGTPIKSRETVMVLQREQLPPTIDAYLTPEEAEQISVGSRVSALIPAENEKYHAHVVKIDQVAPNPSSDNKPVYVQLAFDNLSPEDNGQLIAARGMPVILNIPKQKSIFDRLAFWLK